jgi:phosphopantetheinyl transferase (holo-ACP synthase)
MVTMCPDRDALSAASASAPPVAVWLAGPTARPRFDAKSQTPADQQRWRQIVNPRRRADWEVSRALLTHVRKLSGVALPSMGDGLSMSHSGGFAAVASSRVARRVGVDLECERPRDVTRLAKFAFSELEHAQLEALTTAEARAERFYFLWTLKESFAKALSLPLMTSLSRCEFVFVDGAWSASVPTTDSWVARVWRVAPTVVLSVVAAALHDVSPENLSVSTHGWPEDATRDWRLLGALHSGSD